MEAEELLEKYAAGERKFHSLNLRGIDLEGANLERGDLQKS
jgi:2-iminobutanoate/2-iminopropanoate deaminase